MSRSSSSCEFDLRARFLTRWARSALVEWAASAFCFRFLEAGTAGALGGALGGLTGKEKGLQEEEEDESRAVAEVREEEDDRRGTGFWEVLVFLGRQLSLGSSGVKAPSKSAGGVVGGDSEEKEVEREVGAF